MVSGKYIQNIMKGTLKLTHLSLGVKLLPLQMRSKENLKQKMTFTEWFLQETAKDEDNILPPPLEPQLALNFLREYILGEDWYSANPVPTSQINSEVVDEILYKCSKRYRKEVKEYRKQKGMK